MAAGIVVPFEPQSSHHPQPMPMPLKSSVSVGADRQRVFRVLTVAEYMEAWLAIPDFAADSHLAVSASADRFRIDHFRSRQVDFSITALYRTCRRGKLQLAWHKETRQGSWGSLVLIRLAGDFERTTVSVTHTHLCPGADYLWHKALWEKSLHRLRSLF
jgi:uncharacterized protein YndB with AHSA1/START domain